jgi:hypothetical protein
MARNIKAFHQIIKNNKETYKHNQNHNRDSGKKRKKNRNSPHNNWSLHNHLPREIRNIIPEPPTQNVPALPQNSAPLIRQHRRHSYNKKSESKLQPEAPN